MPPGFCNLVNLYSTRTDSPFTWNATGRRQTAFNNKEQNESILQSSLTTVATAHKSKINKAIILCLLRPLSGIYNLATNSEVVTAVQSLDTDDNKLLKTGNYVFGTEITLLSARVKCSRCPRLLFDISRLAAGNYAILQDLSTTPGNVYLIESSAHAQATPSLSIFVKHFILFKYLTDCLNSKKWLDTLLALVDLLERV